MSAAPRVVAVAPGSPADAGRAAGRATRSLSINGQVPRDVIQWRLLADDADVDARGAPRRARARRSTVAKRAGEPLGVEVSQRRVRPGAHVRQPLRVLLHLPAAARAAPQPVPEGRRLPAVVPVRELHDPDPLHRGRPRAGGHRGPVAAARQHPRHRSRRARRACCATARRARACAGCGPCSTTASGPRPDRRVPGRQRRRRARRHAGRRARRVPRAGVARASCRSA